MVGVHGSSLKEFNGSLRLGLGYFLRLLEHGHVDLLSGDRGLKGRDVFNAAYVHGHHPFQHVRRYLICRRLFPRSAIVGIGEFGSAA